MTTWFSASAVIPQLREDWDLLEHRGAWLTIAVQLGFVAGALLSSVLNLADVVVAAARDRRRRARRGARATPGCSLAHGPGLGDPAAARDRASSSRASIRRR